MQMRTSFTLTILLAASTVAALPPIDKSYSPLPQPVSSFGAVACDGWLYVYGGHTVRTHDYSTVSVSGQFHRLNLADHKTWEKLPGGPALQGLNLATWHDKIYRVGGMKPTNRKDQTESLQSVADCACYDPAEGKWSDLPPMPTPRSSHDVVVAGNKLIVAGGWNLTGDSDNAEWMDTALASRSVCCQPALGDGQAAIPASCVDCRRLSRHGIRDRRIQHRRRSESRC